MSRRPSGLRFFAPPWLRACSPCRHAKRLPAEDCFSLPRGGIYGAAVLAATGELMSSTPGFVYPQPKDSDDDDVVWALQAGATEWQRGGTTDALVWLRRAIEAANAAGNAFRAGEIQASLDDMMERMWGSQPAQAQAGDDVSEADLDDEPLLADDESIQQLDDLDLEEVADDEVVAEEAWSEDESTGRHFPDLSLSEALKQAPGLSTSSEIEAPTASSAPLTLDADDLQNANDVDLDEGDRRSHALILVESFAEQGSLDDDEEDEDQRPTAFAPAEGVTPPPSFEAAGVEGDDQGEDEDQDRQTGIMALVTSIHPPALALGQEPVDDMIVDALEPELPKSLLPPPVARPVAAVDFAPAAVESGPPSVDGIPLGECLGFEDLPDTAQQALAATARVRALPVDEELGNFGAALVTHGAVAVVAAISDEPAFVATKGDVVLTEGSLQDGTALRAVGATENTVVAVWSHADLEAALRACPWVKEQLRAIADRFQALAGTTLGILGERLDASLRRTVLERMEVRAFRPGEMVLKKGVTVPGLYIVGAGRVELLDDDETSARAELLPGDFLFSDVVLSAGAAPSSARAGAKGALLLAASRSLTHELVTSVPPLLEALVS